MPFGLRHSTHAVRGERLHRAMHGGGAAAVQLQGKSAVRHRDLHAGGGASDGAVVLGLAISTHGHGRDARGELMKRNRSRETGTYVAEFAVALPLIILLALI